MNRRPKALAPANARQHGGQGQLRIIGGEWRSRRFAFPDGPGLRPTPDRVRETLFNWLAAYVPGARVLERALKSDLPRMISFNRYRMRQ